MRRGGRILSSALAAAVAAVRPGIRLIDLDAIAREHMEQAGARPSFLGYKTRHSDTPFPSTVCISVNDEIVHGIGTRTLALKEGDVVGLDIGCWYEGLCTDMAVTVGVGKISAEAQKLIEITRASLLAGVAVAKIGGEVADISRAIENTVLPHAYGIVEALVGHGVGHAVHEAPAVPNFIDTYAPKVALKEGMCLAIEPMIALGSHEVRTADDGWAVCMADGSIGAHFEVTIAILPSGPEILTPLPV